MKKRILCLLLVLAFVLPGLPCSIWAADTQVFIETDPVTNTAYKLGMCIKDGTTRYFTGYVEAASVAYRLATTTDLSQAVDVYLEEGNGGWRLYFFQGSTKTYIHFYEANTTNATGSIELTTQMPSSVYTYNRTANTLVFAGSSGNYYMGTFNNYSTISCSNTSYITGNNASKVDVSQFPTRLYKVVEPQKPQEFTRANVVLSDVLGVRFYTPVTDGTVTIALGDGPAAEIAPSPAAAADGCLEYRLDVFAEDMLQTITATLYGTDGTCLDTQVFDFTEYVAAVSDMADQTPAMKELAQAALAYCQYAAREAGKYTGGLADLAPLPQDAFRDHPLEADAAPEGARIFCRLTQACALNLRLPEPWTVTIDGQSSQPVQSGDLYEYRLTHILPQDYDKAHTFTIYRDGQQLFTGNYSVLSYLGALLDRSLATVQQEELLRAMYHYHRAAYAVAYPETCTSHTDSNADEYCDICGETVVVVIDFYTINDLHGKILDSDTQIGVDELSTYLNNARKTDDHVVLLSAGDMWQGSWESSLTEGHIVTDWLSGMDFTAMTLGNHEFDWGSERIRANKAISQFPFLAINIYQRQTNTQVDYCQSSVMVELGGVQVGIIGAIGDCYSSISAEQVADIYFKTGSELTALVKAEATALRSQGADLIVYSLHGDSDSSSTYDDALSNGYVDLVFEGHSHQQYLRTDSYGVYHLQNGGDNQSGISHVEIALNTATDTHQVTQAQLVETQTYQHLADDPIIQQLLDKYASQIAIGTQVLGTNRTYRSSSTLCQILAERYYQEGLKTWAEQYDIVLGGGYLNTRSPYSLPAGDVTYGDLATLFPFDNELVLCSISGRKLRDRFLQTSNSSYYIAYGDYGTQVSQNIDLNATYYVVVDSYTSQYTANGLTEIQRYGPDYYARDLLAQYVRDGGLS